MLAGCAQLRRLHVVTKGPPLTRSRPALPEPRVAELLGHLAAMPHLATVQLFNFRNAAGGEERPVPDQALQLPRVRVPPVAAAEHELDIWAA